MGAAHANDSNITTASRFVKLDFDPRAHRRT
jgi:hypothetical protein